jgi:hypothetical protein
MLLFILAVLIFGSLTLMGVVIRDIGREITGMDSSGKGESKRDDEELTKEIERWREGK